MKTWCLFALCGVLAAISRGQPVAPHMKKIAISDVKATPAVVAAAAKAGCSNSLDRVVQSVDSQLIDSVHNTRKFDVIARSDLQSLLKEADFAGGSFKISGVDYLLVTTIDDFQDYQETREFKALGKSASWRVIRLAAVGKIYDASSGKLIESANFPLEIRDQTENVADAKNGDLSDALLHDITSQLTVAISNRIADVIFPARIIARMDQEVTINRGEGTGFSVGQVWAVFAQGQELVDPDTGASLGREEVQVGKVQVVRITPKTTVARVLEDTGIQNGAILRPLSK
ncbi:curli production assembly/transport component CsgG [mine drainage metagenome]|uniref:Curli production assembly/transport component CsgG n=1 Tax=mine drainage metagenome TaxID=410659 RepID=A0A1J5TFG8_9ZZZZ